MADFEANFVLGQQTEVTANFSVEVANNDHAILVNRDLSDQHPISAITGLQEALDEIPEDYVSDAELESALLEKQDVISDLAQIRSGALLGSTAVQPNDLATALTPYATQSWVENKGYLTEIPAEYVTDSELTAKGYITNAALVGYATESYVTTAVGTETTARQNADNNLQNQIDAITASSDVTDIVGTYDELQSYDTSTLPPNSIIKVLQDENRNNETTYYRWVITGGVGAWSLIGEEGPYYTIAAADAKFATQTALSTGLSDKQDTISDLATIRSGASLGATSVQPSDLSTYVTTNTDQAINGLKTIKNQLKVQSGSGDGALFIGADANNTTLRDNFRKVARVNMPTHEDITLPMTIISGDTSGDSGSTIGQKAGIWNRVEFGGRPGAKYNTSPDGMAFCVATSHNSTLDKVIALEMDATQARFNVQPNYNGANFATETYVNTGLATKQDTLVSGTNIKTINNQSILGSGNIDIQGGSDVEAFTAAEVQTIWNGVL